MVLDKLLGHLADARIDRTRLRSARARLVHGITPDSRRAGPGIVFVSLPERQRENPFQARAALERGAEAVICDEATPLPASAACVRVADPRAALGQAAAALHDHPSRRLKVLGVAGEACLRSRVAAVLADLLDVCGLPAARLGAASCTAGGRCLPVGLGRLDASEVQERLAAHLRSGGASAVVELLPGLEDGGTLGAVEFAARVPAAPAPGVLAAEHLSFRGSSVRLAVGTEAFTVCTPLVGRSQVEALGTALGVVASMGLGARQLAPAITRLPQPAGFLEPVLRGQNYGVLVDRAPDAASLALSLSDARELARGRLIVVAGPRADRTPEERLEFAEAVFRHADEVIVTDDDARPGEFEDLAGEFASVAPEGTSVRIEPGRHEAVRAAVFAGRTGDVVVLAGKGGSGTHRLGDAIVPWDERRHASEALAARGHVGGDL